MNTSTNNVPESHTVTVAQLAVADPAALAVFTKYNIDYCCGGHRSLEDACRRIGLDPMQVKAEILNSSTVSASPALRPEVWSSSLLIDYIVQNHHAYVKRAIPEIEVFLEKVCHAHGSDYDQLLQIQEAFFTLANELTDHMQKEEVVLFPAIKRFEAQNRGDHALVATMQGPLGAMEHEHQIAGDLIKKIRSLSDNYTPPDFACPTFRITYKKLQEFDNDLMQHIHLENNILFERIKEKRPVRNSCSL